MKWPYIMQIPNLTFSFPLHHLSQLIKKQQKEKEQQYELR